MWHAGSFNLLTEMLMPYDAVAAADYADKNAEPASRGKCAEYVRKGNGQQAQERLLTRWTT